MSKSDKIETKESFLKTYLLRIFMNLQRSMKTVVILLLLILEPKVSIAVDISKFNKFGLL